MDYPIVSFYFSVEISGEKNSFQEVSGLSYEMNTTEFYEGGENRMVYHLPTARKYSNLKLKRGILSSNGSFFSWCKETLEGEFEKTIELKNIKISLLDENGDPSCVWNCVNAFPVKWDIDAFSSMDNKIAVETIELQFTHLDRQS